IERCRLLPVCRASHPSVKIRECQPPVIVGELARPYPPRDCGREFGGAKIANHEIFAVRHQKGLGANAGRVDHKQSDENACVKVEAHLSPSSRISLRSVPASVLGIFLPTRLARSHSMSASVIGRVGGCKGFNSTTGWPRRVITTPSPLSARSINFDKWFFAS